MTALRQQQRLRVGSDNVVGIALRTGAQGSACTLLTMSRNRWRRVIDDLHFHRRRQYACVLYTLHNT